MNKPRTVEELAQSAAKRFLKIQDIRTEEGGCSHVTDDYPDGWVCSDCIKRSLEIIISNTLIRYHRNTVEGCRLIVREHLEHANPNAGPDGDHKVISCTAKILSDLADFKYRS